MLLLLFRTIFNFDYNCAQIKGTILGVYIVLLKVTWPAKLIIVQNFILKN